MNSNYTYEENTQLFENFLLFCKLLNLCSNNVENNERIGIQQCMPLNNMIDYVYAIPFMLYANSVKWEKERNCSMKTFHL
uniref:Uncharacterized protein n=1 Tax=Wuchereria bancrofti TaxID=6293 RepID=A0AAF5RUT8_WUCBA